MIITPIKPGHIEPEIDGAQATELTRYMQHLIEQQDGSDLDLDPTPYEILTCQDAPRPLL
jgi:hypothetical protein